jgi:hypothetical protein
MPVRNWNSKEYTQRKLFLRFVQFEMLMKKRGISLALSGDQAKLEIIFSLEVIELGTLKNISFPD